jgi:hypothetical protein
MATWIFQGNPKQWDIDRGLERTRKLLWTVRQRHFVAQIHIGDSVYLWRSEAGKPGTGGVVPQGVVASEPRTYAGVDYPCVWLVLDDIRLTEEAGALPRAILMVDPVLSGLRVIVMAHSTNYRLTPAQACALDHLWLAQKRY